MSIRPNSARLAIHRFLVTPMLIVSSHTADAQPPSAAFRANENNEIPVKVAFLFNFAKLTRWPESPAGAFKIGVLGDDAMAAAMRQLTAGRKVKNLPVEVVSSSKGEGVTGCQILFIGASVQAIAQVVTEFEGRAVLLISDAPRFVERGGAVELSLRANRIRFLLNRKALHAAGLRMSAELMDLAEKGDR